MNAKDNKKEELVTVLSAGELDKRITELGQQINKEYAGKSVVLICVLKGAFLFFSDLVRKLDLELELDFVRLASYGGGTSTSGRVIFTKDLEVSIDGKDVIIVEDIVDSGRTMEYFKRILKQRNPNSLKICALVDKHERREVDLDVDFVGFNLTDKGFIVGYGLDHAEKYRELDAIYELVNP